MLVNFSRLFIVATGFGVGIFFPLVFITAKFEPQNGVIRFAGYDWQTKVSDSLVGPGPNYFSDTSSSIYTDLAGNLHMKIAKEADRWHGAEIISFDSFGYGTYAFVLEGSFARLDENVVAGMFTWDEYAPEEFHREIDIELRTKPPAAFPYNVQYTVQPWDQIGNTRDFFVPLLQDSTHSFEWQPHLVRFLSKNSKGEIVESWNYRGSDVPVPGKEKARMNIWLIDGRAPFNNKGAEIVIKDFTFQPRD